MTLSHFNDYFRCPEHFSRFDLERCDGRAPGFFRFGPDAICYGATASGHVSARLSDALFDALPHVGAQGGAVRLPFDAGSAIDGLRFERYAARDESYRHLENSRWRSAYYLFRGTLPRVLRQLIHRTYFRGWEKIAFPKWPVDFSVESIFERLAAASLKARGAEEMPFIWFWPEGAPYCALMTHDVEMRVGRDFCAQLMDIDDRFGVKSAFQVIPEERYEVTPAWLAEFRRRGFEVNVHDLNHDGRLFASHETFLQRAGAINRYGREFGARGFRSGALYRNQEWYGALDFSYDMSVPCTGRLEVQRGGCCTTMPYFVGKVLEIPLTTTQDYALFNVLNDYSTRLWQEQLEAIADRHGLASFIAHPDYLLEARARRTYESLLEILAAKRAADHCWVALPGEVDRWWRDRHASRLVQQGGEWSIEGPARERGRVAFACLQDGEIRYTFESCARKPAGEPQTK